MFGNCIYQAPQKGEADGTPAVAFGSTGREIPTNATIAHVSPAKALCLAPKFPYDLGRRNPVRRGREPGIVCPNITVSLQ